MRGVSGAADCASVLLRAVLLAVLLVLRAVLLALALALRGRSRAVLGSAAAMHCSFFHPQIWHPPP